MKCEMQFTYCYRPCKVDERKGIFHRWEDYQDVIDAGLTIESHTSGQISRCYGIVEFEDGKVARIDPRKIVFMDFVCKSTWEDYFTRDDFEKEKSE